MHLNSSQIIDFTLEEKINHVETCECRFA